MVEGRGYGHRIIDNSAVTRSSLHVWRATRPLFSTFVEAFATFDGGQGTSYRYAVAAGPDGSLGSAVPLNPGLVLVDDEGSDLWLSGCSCGFGGEGPTATAYILLHEGFAPEHIDELVPAYQRFHIRKGQAAPLVAEPKADGRRGPRNGMVNHIRKLQADGYFADVDAV